MINFWMADEHIAIAKAVGAIPEAGMIPQCNINVGDTVSFPAFRGIAFRVKSRHYRSGNESDPPRWLLELEPAPHPF